jgi:hypothetical protein
MKRGKEPTRLHYIVADKEEGKAYLVTDVIGVSEIIGRNKHTVHSWFRNGKTYHKYGKYCIFKGYSVIKSRRMNLNNLKPFSSV